MNISITISKDVTLLYQLFPWKLARFNNLQSFKSNDCQSCTGRTKLKYTFQDQMMTLWQLTTLYPLAKDNDTLVDQAHGLHLL